jgi:hypothetical protein
MTSCSTLPANRPFRGNRSPPYTSILHVHPKRLFIFNGLQCVVTIDLFVTTVVRTSGLTKCFLLRICIIKSLTISENKTTIVFIGE